MVERRDIFVGRKRELAELTAAFESAMAGRGRLVMLVGEPGIGKTRTAEELAELGRRRGAEILWGRCPEEPGAPPFWSWIQIFRECIGRRSVKVLRSELGSGAADIAELVPEISERIAGLKPSPPLETAEAARFRLFDSVVAFLKKASQSSPLVLVLDNLHWADGSSLRLLEFAVQELSETRILILGTYRDVDVSRGHPLFRSLGALARYPTFQRLLLRGLGQREVGDMIAAAGVERPPDRLAALVHENTEGNPLFVREIVQLLGHEDLLRPDRLSDVRERDIRLPEGIREVIGRRLDILSAQCNAVLTLASVVGREFSADLLGRLVEFVPPGDAAGDDAGGGEAAGRQKRKGTADAARSGLLMDALDEAVTARIIEAIADRAGNYRFSHALIQRTLAEEIPQARRVRMHALIGTSLEALYGKHATAHAAELAHHFAAAETVVGSEKVARYAAAAGVQALAVHGFDEAVTHFERARDAMGEASQTERTADIFYGLGRAQLGLNRFDDAVGNLRRAFPLFIRSHDVGKAVEIVATMAHSTDYALAMGDLIEDAASIVPTESADAARVFANYGFYLGSHRDGHARAVDAFDRAISIARGLGDIGLEASALVNYAMVDGRHLRWRECVEKCRQVLKLIEGSDHTDTRMKAHQWSAALLSWLGEPADVPAHALAASAAAASLRDRRWMSTTAFPAAGLACFKGQWAEARRLINRGLITDPQFPTLVAMQAYVEYELGNELEGDDVLRRMVATSAVVTRGVERRQIVSPIAHAYRLTGSARYLDQALASAEWILSDPAVTPMNELHARAGLAQIAAVERNTVSAAEHYARLLPFRGRITHAFVAIDGALGRLAQTMGQSDPAVAHYEDALTFCRKAGYRPELAWTCHDYANMLISTAYKPRPGNRRLHQAGELLEEALAIASDLGMKPLYSRLSKLASALEALRRGMRVHPGGLSGREIEVLRLVGAGRTNHEIAGQLVISEHTVARHIANIFAKTGASNRAEAATYASKHGLLI